MKKDEIQTLYQYNAWANARILDATAHVSDEQFLAPAPFPHGGLRDTLVHILSAEWIWRKRWEGDSPPAALKCEEFPSFQALQERWQAEEKKLLAFVETVSERALNGPLPYRTTGGKRYENILWHLMVHLVNHGTQHRSEAAAMLTTCAHSPGDIDLIVFLRNQ